VLAEAAIRIEALRSDQRALNDKSAVWLDRVRRILALTRIVRVAAGTVAGLDLGDPAVLDSGRPGWEHFGRVLPARGPAMSRRLREFKLDPLWTAAQTAPQEAAQGCR